MNINLHTLTSYPPSCLNRGFDGHPKTARFGDSLRTRVSSASVKASWKAKDSPTSFGDLFEGAERSRIVFKECVAQPLIDGGLDPVLVVHATLPWVLEICGRSESAERKAASVDLDDPLASLERGEAVCLTEPEIRWIRSRVAASLEGVGSREDATAAGEASVKAHKGDIRAIADNASFETALFGRMTTGDALARTESALWVSHRLSVTRHERIDDSVALIDSIITPRNGTAATLSNQPLVSGMFYGYDVLSLPILTSNLSGYPQKECRKHMTRLAAEIVERWIMTVFNSVPRAKRGSTAPMTKPALMLVEIGEGWQHNLSDAFQQAAADATLGTAASKLAAYMTAHDAYAGDPASNGVKRYYACVDSGIVIPNATRVTVKELARICAEALPVAEKPPVEMRATTFLGALEASPAASAGKASVVTPLRAPKAEPKTEPKTGQKQDKPKKTPRARKAG